MTEMQIRRLNRRNRNNRQRLEVISEEEANQLKSLDEIDSIFGITQNRHNETQAVGRPSSIETLRVSDYQGKSPYVQMPSVSQHAGRVQQP